MSRFGFADVLAACERTLVAGLTLAPLTLPPDLATMDGEWKGAPVRLRARAWSGPRIRYARFVHVDGALDIANLLCLSRPEWPLPLLGADLVDVGREAAVVVADLSPLAPRQAPHPRAAELPAWCAAWLSDGALFTRVTPDEASTVEHRVLDHVRTYVDLAASARPHQGGADDVRQRQQAYCAAHLEDDRGLQLLVRMFDHGRGERFLREVLFPIGEAVFA